MKTKENIFERIKNIFFPREIKCVCCSAELSHDSRYSICDECMKKLPFSFSKVCKKCGESLNNMSDYCMSCKDHVERYFSKARSPFIYQDEIASLIQNLKYSNAKYLGKYLSNFLVDEYVKHNFNVDFVIPIPLNEKRFKERGYNQAELLSQSFETELNLKIETENFVRVKNTPTQTLLSMEERKHNLTGAFKVLDKSKFKGKKVLLIDDVFTTGSTMEEASRCLLKAGVSEVYCLTLAHTLPKKMMEK